MKKLVEITDEPIDPKKVEKIKKKSKKVKTEVPVDTTLAIEDLLKQGSKKKKEQS